MHAALLAFGNDWIDDKRHLRSLLDESKAIGKALAPVVKAGLAVLPVLYNATVRGVIETFRERHEQIRVFHFGGHASSSTLLFEDDTGHTTEAHAHGLADTWAISRVWCWCPSTAAPPSPNSQQRETVVEQPRAIT